MRFHSAALVLCVCGASASGAEIGYYSQPALHGRTLVFVSEGDLWSATLPDVIDDRPIVAHRLTSGDGEEMRPHISPDGRLLAFTAQYEGNSDVYIMPIDGGVPTRLTGHPAPELTLGWSSDGASVLFASNARHPFNRPELWRVSATSNGSLPEPFAIGECSMVSMSSTGRRFAFTRWSNEHWTWKRYRGGTAPDVWLGDLSAGTFTQLTSDRGNDMFPMWIGGRVYFSSDRSGLANIYSASPESGENDLRQHTRFAADASMPLATDGHDVRWPSMDTSKGAQRIVFCQAGGLAVLDVGDDRVTRLNVHIASDRVQARRRFTQVAQALTEFALSPDGKTVVIGSRGEILSANVETGEVDQLTREAASREWGAAFVSNEQLALITDADGEQQVALLSLKGGDGLRAATRDREAWLFPPRASPNGKLLAFADKTLRLHVLDLDALTLKQIDQSEAGEITDYRFSPDSQWLAYAKPMPNGMSHVHIANVRTGRTFAASTPLCDDARPRWDPKGRYLYMLSNRHLNPVMSRFDTEHALINTSQVIAIALATDTPPLDKRLMLAAGFDVEEWSTPAKPKGDDAGSTAAAPKQPAPPEPDDEIDQAVAATIEPMRIDTDGLSLRQHVLPVPPAEYGALEAVIGGLLLVANPVEGLMDDPWPAPPLPKGVLKRWDLLKAESRDLASGVNGFSLSGDGGSVAYLQTSEKGEPATIKVMPSSGAAEADPSSVKTIDIASQQMRVEIPAEWGQILGEAWRLQRDFYWAPNMAGVNWPAMRAKYEALLPRIGTRAELNDLVGQLIGELGTSHTYLFGGQAARDVKTVGVGLLGADIEFDGRGHRIVRILPSQNWDATYVSPLAEPSLRVREGAYVRSINGMPLASPRAIYDALQGQAGRIVRLTISDDGGPATRDVTVKALDSEQPLRYAEWVERNRKYVEEKSAGKVGYVHIPDMGGEGLVMFSRYFYPQFNKPALVIDVRDNGGGFVSQMIIERLSRKLLAFDQPRHGVTGRYPTRAVNAHMVTLIDQHAGSDGDIFPSAFRKLNLGPLIGMRTWGGVVGIRGDKAFVDRGLSTQPEFAWWESEGGWVIENVGVEPDIEIDNTPADRLAGRDAQLDFAIDHLVKRLAESPIEQPQVPAWPVRTGN